MRGLFQSHVPEERVDGSQSDISGTSAVFASAFQVIEKEANEGRVEILDPELGRHFVESFFGKLQKQAETIAISRDGMRTRLPLAKRSVKKAWRREEKLAEVMAASPAQSAGR